jgi:pyroglutamyl-peptidase
MGRSHSSRRRFTPPHHEADFGCGIWVPAFAGTALERHSRTLTILITGFGLFPGSPFNPTGPLVQRLARPRRPRLAHIRIIPHIFPTSYAAVDHELPRLLAAHRPDAVLMFRLAPWPRVSRIDTRVRNTVTLLLDANGAAPPRHTIAPGGPAAMSAPVRRLLAAVRAAGVPATLSRDAGRYLCNYLARRVAAAAKNGGPHLAAFVHVPKVARFVRRPAKRRRLTLGKLARAGTALLAAGAAVCHVSDGKHR